MNKDTKESLRDRFKKALPVIYAGFDWNEIYDFIQKERSLSKEEGRREERERIYKEAAIISQQFIDSDSSVEAGKRYIYDLGNLLGHLTDKDKTHE